MAGDLKTLFLLLPVGLTVRNFVATGVLKRLADDPSVRVVAFGHRLEEMDLSGANGVVLRELPVVNRYTISRVIHRLLRVRFLKIQQTETERSKARTLRSLKPWVFIMESLISTPFPRSRRLFRWIRSFESRRKRGSIHIKALFEEYDPVLVVSTTPATMDEYDILNYATQAGIPTVAMFRSWDVLLTKGYMPQPPGRYLAWTETMRRTIRDLYNVPESRIDVTGIPQFDVYAEPMTDTRRERFLTDLGLDPRKKTILFATSGPNINPDEPALVDALATSLQTWDDAQVLVRLHPIDQVERYDTSLHTNVAYQVPGTETERSLDDRFTMAGFMPTLRDTLGSSDVVINTASTMSLDAVAMGRPVINLAIDLQPTPYHRSTRRYYDFDHYRPLVESGAIRVVRTVDELATEARRYLTDPTQDRVARDRLRDAMCGQIDGQSAQRVAASILGALTADIVMEGSFLREHA